MNKVRRDKIGRLIDQLKEFEQEISDLYDEEEEEYDNTPASVKSK